VVRGHHLVSTILFKFYKWLSRELSKVAFATIIVLRNAHVWALWRYSELSLSREVWQREVWDQQRPEVGHLPWSSFRPKKGPLQWGPPVFFFNFWTLKTGLTHHLDPVSPSLAHRHVTSSSACCLDFILFCRRGRRWPLGPRHTLTPCKSLFGLWTLFCHKGTPLTIRFQAAHSHPVHAVWTLNFVNGTPLTSWVQGPVGYLSHHD